MRLGGKYDQAGVLPLGDVQVRIEVNIAVEGLMCRFLGHICVFRGCGFWGKEMEWDAAGGGNFIELGVLQVAKVGVRIELDVGVEDLAWCFFELLRSDMGVMLGRGLRWGWGQNDRAEVHLSAEAEARMEIT